jgi:hypothetical protein
MRMMLVSWFDAVSEDAWTELDEAKKTKLHLIHTAGFLVSEDDTRIIIGSSWDVERDAIASFIAIPRLWISNIKEFKNPLYGVPTEAKRLKAKIRNGPK